VLVLGEYTRLGRGGDSDVQVVDMNLSRHHACILVDDDGLLKIQDLGSRNGTYVNEIQVNNHLLRSGDVVRIGNSRFVYQELDNDLISRHGENMVKVLGGPAREFTVTDVVPGRGDGCSDPLHRLAVQQDWRRCPACGKELK